MMEAFEKVFSTFDKSENGTIEKKDFKEFVE